MPSRVALVRQKDRSCGILSIPRTLQIQDQLTITIDDSAEYGWCTSDTRF